LTRAAEQGYSVEAAAFGSFAGEAGRVFLLEEAASLSSFPAVEKLSTGAALVKDSST
jgi:hypothetical protein